MRGRLRIVQHAFIGLGPAPYGEKSCKCYVDAVVRSGADLKTIMELARHSTASLSMNVYASVDPVRKRDAAQAAAKHLEEEIFSVPCCTYVPQAKTGTLVRGG